MVYLVRYRDEQELLAVFRADNTEELFWQCEYLGDDVYDMVFAKLPTGKGASESWSRGAARDVNEYGEKAVWSEWNKDGLEGFDVPLVWYEFKPYGTMGRCKSKIKDS